MLGGLGTPTPSCDSEYRNPIYPVFGSQWLIIMGYFKPIMVYFGVEWFQLLGCPGVFGVLWTLRGTTGPQFKEPKASSLVDMGINPTLLILAAWPMIPCNNRENTWRYMMRSLATAMHDDHRSKMTFQQAAQKIKKLALVMKHALAGDRQAVKLSCLDQAIDRNLYVYATEFSENLMDEIKAGRVDPSRLLADVVADQSFLYGAVTTSLRFKPPKSQSFLFQTRTDQWFKANSEVYHHNLTRGRAFASRTNCQHPRVVLWALVLASCDSGRVCRMGPYLVYGMYLVCIGVQIFGPC